MITETPHETLLRHIQKTCSLEEKDNALFMRYFKPIAFNRKELILSNGNISHHLYFVLSGTLHHFFTDQQGQQYSCSFALPGTFITDLESFSNQRPSTHSVEALNQSQCLRISCVDCIALMNQSKAFHTYIYQMLEKVAHENLQRTTDLISLTPEQRYEKLELQQKQLLQTVPQKYLASYLGISPESLSRLKKRRILI